MHDTTTVPEDTFAFIIHPIDPKRDVARKYPLATQPAPISGERSSGSRAADVRYLAALLGLVVLLFAPYLFVLPAPVILPESDLGTDFTREIWPVARLIADTVHRTSQLPLWRPYLLSGAPLAGHPVIPLLYPSYWLILVLPLSLALNLHVVFHLWWSGAGMYLSLRVLSRLQPGAAFVGAIIMYPRN